MGSGGDNWAVTRTCWGASLSSTVTPTLSAAFCRAAFALSGDWASRHLYISRPVLRSGPESENREEAQYELLGRLAPGQSLPEFQSRVLAKADSIVRALPGDGSESGRVEAWPVHRFGLFVQSSESSAKVLLLFGSVLVILVLLLAVVACLNVAGLLIARAMARQREIAVRLSIGCGRTRLARLLMTESFLLAALGIGLGALASIWLARILVAIPLPFPVAFEVEVPVDLHLLAYLAGLVGLATVTAAWLLFLPPGVFPWPRA